MTRIVRYIFIDILRTRFTMLYTMFLLLSTFALFQLDSDPGKGRQAVMQVDNVKLVLTERRSAFTEEHDFTQLGINPLAHKIVVVKLGYLFPDLLRIAPRAYMALSTGAADQNLARLPYRRIARPMFPLDQEFTWSPA